MMLGLDHIAIIVSSEESLRFYEKLGFKESQRIERDYDAVVFMGCAGVTLEIFIDPKHPERFTDPETKGLRHIAFVVDDIEKIAGEIECEEIRTDWFGRKFTFCKDPDGQPIELKEKAETKPANSNDPFVKEYKKQTGEEISFF